MYDEELLALHPTPKLKDYPLSAIRYCLFNTFAATLHIWSPFLHPQLVDAPCRGDRDPLIVASIHTASLNDLQTNSAPQQAQKDTFTHTYLH